MAAAAAGATMGLIFLPIPVVGQILGGALGAFLANAALPSDPEPGQEDKPEESRAADAERDAKVVAISKEESKVLDRVVVYLKDYLDKEQKHFPPTNVYPESLVSRFNNALRARNIEHAGEISTLLHDVALADQETISVLSAVQELRRQLHGPQADIKATYSKSHGDAIEFLLTNYGDDIRTGTLGPGQLQARDRNLYKYASAQLRDTGKTLGDFFDEQKKEVGISGTALARRAQAAAVILGTSESEAARFLRTLQPERLGARLEQKERVR
jgi:hypothetical protein